MNTPGNLDSSLFSLFFRGPAALPHARCWHVQLAWGREDMAPQALHRPGYGTGQTCPEVKFKKQVSFLPNRVVVLW